MALSKSSKAPKPKGQPLSLPPSRLSLTFRELSIDGHKSGKYWIVFTQMAADAGDLDCQAIVDCFRKLKKREQETATPEYCAQLAGVDAEDLAAAVFREFFRYSGDASNLIEAAARPSVVRKSVKVAMTNAGHRDRAMLLTHANFLPQKHGGGIHVNASASAESKNATFVQAPELPRPEDETIRFTRVLKDSQVTAIDSQRALPPPVPALGGNRTSEP